MQPFFVRSIALATLLVAGMPVAAQQNPSNPPVVKGFGVDSKTPPPAGFGKSATEPTTSTRPDANSRKSSSVSSYARSWIKRYDRNKNGQIDRQEWDKVPGKPSERDLNGDGVIKLSEISTWLNKQASRTRSARSTRFSRSTRNTSPSKSSAGKNQAAKQPPSDRKSYRFTPATERLPKGLPSWFKSRDRDRDGQVAMHEYATKWSSSRVREFKRYDKNGDGLITPAEAAKR